MNIGDVAHRSGLPKKTIRYYEDIGLVKPARDGNGYRVFNDQNLHTLAFIGRARTLGFSIEDCRALLGLWRDDQRTSSDVKTIALGHVKTLKIKIAEMQAMVRTLKSLAETCHGDDSPDCPILDDLATKTNRADI